MRQWILVPALLLAAGFHAAGAQASGDRMAGDAASGERLAQSWCSACHAVGVSGADVAAPLREIVRRPDRSRAFLYGWLSAPHPPMPPLSLSHREIADLMAYLDRLEAGP